METIQEGAIFVADAHYGLSRPDFLDFLRLIDDKKIEAPQLFLLGDMFDFLAHPIHISVLQNREAIELLNKISQHTDIHYFEGNHDFLLKGLFGRIKIYPLGQQPATFIFNGKTVEIAHGDNSESLFYRLYTAILRKASSVFIVRLLTLDFINDWFVKAIFKAEAAKKQCSKKIEDFESKVTAKIEQTYTADTIIEGHYHQGVEFKLKNRNYHNLGAFACNQSFFKVESKNDELALVELNFRSLE